MLLNNLPLQKVPLSRAFVSPTSGRNAREAVAGSASAYSERNRLSPRRADARTAGRLQGRPRASRHSETLPWMAPPFDDRWEDLSLDKVREFLNAAAFEALTWEAKGGVAPRSESVRKAVCGFANARGGTLILGAESGGDPPAWRLDGMTFRDEPPVWLSSVIADGGVACPPVRHAKLVHERRTIRGTGRDRTRHHPALHDK
jgi:hypothetical protein